MQDTPEGKDNAKRSAERIAHDGDGDISTDTKDEGFVFNKDPRFWAIIIAIAFAALLTALESTITSTALPTIIADLGGGDLYIWTVNGYFVSM